jgi:hypothetical protein
VAGLTERRVQLYASLAAEHDVHILAGPGPMKSSKGRFVNGAHLVAPNGLVGCQEKNIMTPFEKEWGVQAGSQLKVFDTGIGRIGVLICYDCEFPLLARAMAEAGAEILLVPSCTERVSGFNRVRIGAQARTLEIGVCDDGVLAQGVVNEVGWLNGSIDLMALRELRDKGEMRNFHDWSLQAGAGGLELNVELVCLK